jgi:hypothetical protein
VENGGHFLETGFIFEWKKHMDSVHGSWTGAALAHGGPRSMGRRWLVGAWHHGRSGARNLTVTEVKERGGPVILTRGKMRWRGGGLRLATTDTGGGYTSSPGKRFSLGERELWVGKDAVEDGEGVGAFYRPGGGGRWADGKRSVARWSFKALKPLVLRRGNRESVIGCGRGGGGDSWFPGTEGVAARSACSSDMSPDSGGGDLGSRGKMPDGAGVGPQGRMGQTQL